MNNPCLFLLAASCAHLKMVMLSGGSIAGALKEVTLTLQSCNEMKKQSSGLLTASSILPICGVVDVCSELIAAVFHKSSTKLLEYPCCEMLTSRPRKVKASDFYRKFIAVTSLFLTTRKDVS